MNDLIMAKLVYDGGDSVIVPSEMGTPREDQLQGTPAERLTELAGRVCYDSLGKGRPSFTQEGLGTEITGVIQGYHDHIKQVGHGSVWEHFNFTVAIEVNSTPDRHLIAWLCCNRPGVLVIPDKDSMRVTLNLRSVIEWMNFSKEFYSDAVGGHDYVGEDKWISRKFRKLANQIAPHIVDDTPVIGETIDAELVEPINDHERWVSMYLTGSRGLSHELVRHGDFTAISQRSTRFVDESESPWVEHPLETKQLDEFHKNMTIPMASRGCVLTAKEAYSERVAELEPWLIARGIDKTSARKQARGAARGYLGNALHTELIFSANVAQWKRMLRQRASVFADAEIRELFCKVLTEMKRWSRYADCFDGWELADSPDGIGQIAVEKSAVTR